ncbi:MAG: M13 family metallopeptidase [Candidatus Cloacimonetes bacterium]|nr:M13 family metallopeptidase [Candidatus Cloacimonadota bacterium]
MKIFMVWLLIIVIGNLIANESQTIDFSIMDTSINPGDNFYRYANGKWLNENSLPEGRSRFGFFDIAENRTNNELILMMQEKTEDTLQKLIAEFYTSGMDTIAIKKTGISALAPQLEMINKISDNPDLTRALAYLQLIGINPLFEIHSPKYWEMRGTHYLYLRQTVTTLENSPDTEIIQQLARAITPSSKKYNLYNLRKLQRAFPNIIWEEYFMILQIEDKKTVIAEPDYFEMISDMLAEYSIAEWKAYLEWKLLDSAESLLKASADRELFVMQTISDCLPELTGHLYTQKYFNNETRQQVHNITSNLQSAFRIRINDKDWLSSKTKKLAVQKIDNFTFKIGEPDFNGSDYAELQIDPAGFLQNVFNSRKLHTINRLQNCGSILKNEEWIVPAHSTNAWYSINRNDITLPAAYINQLFDINNDAATSYAQLATAIAHEMTHSLDDMGRRYNADGKSKKWWKKSEIKYFNILSQKLVNQYDSYILIDTLHVNGKNTLGENIADLGGLNIAYDAYKIATAAEESEILNGFSPDQRFFLAYAQKWRDILSDDLKRQYATGYYHAPPEFRTNGNVYNLDAFYDSFSIEKGKPYKKKENRINIW